MAELQQVQNALSAAEAALSTERVQGADLKAKLDEALQQLANLPPNSVTPEQLDELKGRIDALTTGISNIVDASSGSSTTTDTGAANTGTVGGTGVDSAPAGGATPISDVGDGPSASGATAVDLGEE